MKLLVLGGGFNQLNAIRKAREKGYEVVVSDYLPDAPGRKLADYAELVSTFDIEGNIQVGCKHKIDGVFTVGTDQPVLTAARVAEALNLPHMITSDTALRATNKKYMKEVFVKKGIPTSSYILIKRAELDDKQRLAGKLNLLRFPLVIKPLDSQGQRGIFKIYEFNEQVINYMRETFTFTRSDEIIAEEFFPGDEISLSIWVENGFPYILMITDRPLLNVEPHLGIPAGHVFPSFYTWSHCRRLQQLAGQVVDGFDIKSGPLYIQVLASGEDIQVVEIACRIGGGHEDELIPLVTGIDILDMLVEKAAGKEIEHKRLEDYDLLNNEHHAIVKFIIAHPGRVKYFASLDKILKMPGVIKASFYNPALKEIRPLVDSTCRVGYLLVEGKTEKEMYFNTSQAYKCLRIVDENGSNMVIDMSSN